MFGLGVWHLVCQPWSTESFRPHRTWFFVSSIASTRSSRHVPSSVAPAVHWTIRNCSRQQLCFRHHTWSEARWCFEPYVVQFWTGTCHAKLETIFEITRSTRWCCWQTHKYPVRGRSFVICEVVERTGGDVGITGCGTQPCGFAAEYLENQIVHDFVFATSIIHRWLRWFVGRVVGRGETQVSWPYHLRTFEASRPGWTATQNPNWLDDFSQIQMYSHKQTHCFEIAFATVWCRCLSHNPIWFGYPAFDKIWLSHRGQTTTENASINCWVGYDMTVKIGPIPCPGWIGELLLQWLFGNANHGPGRYSASSFVSQQKFSINKIPGLQQQARGLQPMSGSKIFPLNPSVGKVVHPNDGMTI